MRFSRMLTVVDAHTEGNPERVVISGIPSIPGATMLEKARFVQDHMDHLRTFLINEPRGHANMYAALVIPPADERADFGILYLEPGGYSTMCGHGTIAICTVLTEIGLVKVQEPITEITLDTPAGLVKAQVAVERGSARSVTIRNVPSFLFKRDAEVDVPELGKVQVDVSYGGNFFAMLPSARVGLSVRPEQHRELIECGTRIWRAVNEQIEVRHPLEPKINCVTYVEFYGPAHHPQATSKNAVIVPPSGMDRSPCGTGTSAKMAALYARGELGLHQPFVHESIIGTLYYGELIEETRVGDYPAVIPTIRGSAHVTGIHHLVLDPRDPFPAGFALGKQERLYGVG
ncbi:MAG: proline racemase family protein [Ignavibacteriales bacterium]